MALLSDHRILVTGVLTDDSSRLASPSEPWKRGRASLSRAPGEVLHHSTHRRKLGDVGEVIELDVTSPSRSPPPCGNRSSIRRLDGLVHALVTPHRVALAKAFRRALRRRATAMHISTYSLAALVGFRPLLQKEQRPGGASWWLWTLTAPGPIRCTTGWA